MIDIKEIAKRYTREEFLNLNMDEKRDILNSCGNCPNGSGLKTFHCCTDTNITICEETCRECWSNAIKDIKFKDEIWVKCINDLGSKALTVNKEYMVISQGDTWIEIKNDSNINYEYLKEAFEIIEEGEKMKEYSHEEVIKIINDDEIYVNKDKNCVVSEIHKYNGNIHYELRQSRTNFGVAGTFIKLEKPVNFSEVLHSNKRCRVEHELIDKLIDNEECDFNFAEYNEIDDLLFEITNQCIADETRNILLNGKWYLE